MELAAYIYDAWAYEIANQEANQEATELNLTYCDELCADKDQGNELDWNFTAIKRQAYLLSAIAFTSLSGWGWNLAPVMAAQVLEPSVNVAPWCDNLYICETSYMLDVQTLLARRGFAVGEIDGVYGRYTKQAVIDFQRTQTNLVADGIPGARTLALLRNSSAIQPITPQQPKPTIQTTTKPTIQTTTGSDRPSQTIVIVRSDNSQPTNILQEEGSEVGNLQILLKQRGFYQGEIDGRQGQSTTDAILKAQLAYGLPLDSFAGPLTIRALSAGGSNVSFVQQAVNRSPTSQDVVVAQMLLRDRGFYDGELNGMYNISTKASILKAQLAYGQTATGDLGADLFTSLKSQNNGQNITQNIPQNISINPNNQNAQPIPNIPNSTPLGNGTAPTSSQNAPIPPAKNSNSS
jgi:peptidoglycan hydrolase-like protein with peptidoglycan-binding domain